MEIRKIKISPEVLKMDLSAKTYNSKSVGFYPPLSELLISGRKRNPAVGLIQVSTRPISRLTDLTIPILLTQDYQDMGYYSPFDGNISYLNEEINFIFSADPTNNKKIYVYNTSKESLKFLKETTFTVNWGLDSPCPNTVVNNYSPNSVFCVYNNLTDKDYTITLSADTSIGELSIQKTIKLPYSTITSNNPYGTVTFSSNINSWQNTPSSQNYIFLGDSLNTIQDQLSSNYVTVPFIVSGYTMSRITEMFIYGPNKLSTSVIITLKDGTTGKTLSIGNTFTSYTINDVLYIDYKNGLSTFQVESYGITSEMISQSAVTKLDYLMNIINSTEIESNVFIERGINSGTENFRRIGEVGSTGELQTYGYRFFDVRFYNDI